MSERIANELFGEERRKVYYLYTIKLLNNHHDTEDVLAVVYQKASKSLSVNNIPNKRLKAWLIRICHNEACRFITENRKETLYGGLTYDEAAFGAGRCDAAVENFYNDVIDACLSLAPKEVQEALKEHIFYDKPLGVLSKKLTIPIGTLRYWKKRIEKAGRNYL